jgi:hypothetical protein
MRTAASTGSSRGTPRQPAGIEDQDGVDVRGIIELAAAMLAERQGSEALCGFAGRALRDCRGDRPVECPIRQVGKLASHLFQRHQSGEIADRDDKCQRVAFAPQRTSDRLLTVAPCMRRSQCARQITRRHERGQIRIAFQRMTQERGVCCRAIQRIDQSILRRHGRRFRSSRRQVGTGFPREHRDLSEARRFKDKSFRNLGDQPALFVHGITDILQRKFEWQTSAYRHSETIGWGR